MAKSVAALLLVKEHSTRLPGKNTMDFFGKPMFLWNVEKCLRFFSNVYVSSDSQRILGMAAQAGALTILRGDDLVGDVPDIPVYQHAIDFMEGVDGIVAVHGNNPTIEPNIIALVKHHIEIGVPEVMTCHPTTENPNYHEQHNKIYGSVRGMSVARLLLYGDPYKPKPNILIEDTSIEIETPESLEKAICQYKRQL